MGGSGTSALTFRTTVASTDTSTSALAITGVNLANGASIHDASGVAANLAGAVKTFTGLQIDPPVAPAITPAVTQATASPATGTEVVGNTITLKLGFNEAVTVTGTPKLSLNDGGTASYVSGLQWQCLASYHGRTDRLEYRRSPSRRQFWQNGASIKDAGVPPSAADTSLPGLQVETSSIAPVLLGASAASVAPGAAAVDLGSCDNDRS